MSKLDCLKNYAENEQIVFYIFFFLFHKKSRRGNFCMLFDRSLYVAEAPVWVIVLLF